MADYQARLASKLAAEEGDQEEEEKVPQRDGGEMPMPPSPYTSIEGDEVEMSASYGPQCFAAFAATMGNLVMGTSISWTSPAIPLLQKSEQEGGFSLSKSESSWVGSLMPIGALVGGQVGGLLMSKLGRRGAMMTGAVMFAFSYLILVLAPNVWFVYIGRFATGLCTGICSVVCPVYVAETATPKMRGLLGACVQLMVVFGVMLVIVMGLAQNWRWVSIACLLMIVIWAVCLLFVPETPAHFISKGEDAAAREALEWLRGTNRVDQEFYQIKRSLDESAQLSAGLGDLVTSPNLAPFIVSLMLMFGQQLSGMNAVMFYCVDIFKAAHSGLDPTTANIIIGAVQIVATLLAAVVMDKAGRRLLLNLSAFFMVFSISLLGFYFYASVHMKELAGHLTVVPLISLSVFVFAFSIGFGPIPWLMMSELFAPEVKSVASSISTTFNWTLAFLVTKFFSNMVDALTEAGAFWVFGGITILTFFFCLLFVPETKGKSLDDIQQLFRSPRPYFLEIDVWKLLRGGAGPEEERPILEEVY